MSTRQYIVGIVALLGVVSCSKKEVKPDTLFREIGSDKSGISFANQLTFNKEFNIYTYRNYYNGGGAAVGDVNNDGLVDIYLTANMLGNKLYINKGGFVFEDVTQKAGVTGTKAWSTGVSMADVNGDGWIDIYVCNSGDIKGDNKQNELFINNGDLTFTDKAAEYGVDDKGYTTHAAFFDYDRDGDLDLYILNNSYQAIGSFNLRKNERPKRDPLGGDKLLRNDGNKFIDVSEAAGIYGSVIGFGLGVTVGDVDKDGWSDIYISNDFFERDYLYINNHDGTFKEDLTRQMRSISGASMGADLADINNDTYPDIFVTEMLPHDNARLKTVTTFENWDRYQYAVQNDYYHQFTRNMLQLNNGNNTFSEIGRLSGVEATDWSWGALMYDMDNDGLKDIFVANGIYQDLTNQDYLQYISNEEIVRSIVAGGQVNYEKLVELIPSNPVPDFAFRNRGNLHFEDKAAEWGLGEPNFSNGAAYGDFDNDGDLDLIVNRVNSKAALFENRSREMNGNHFLKFVLKGNGLNTHAFGTTMTLFAGDSTFFLEQMPIRGFESSVDPRPNFGLGKIRVIDSAKIAWPNGKVTLMKDVKTDQVIQLRQDEAISMNTSQSHDDRLFSELRPQPISYVHHENEFIDFDRDRLVFHMISNEGPKIAVGDVNGDRRADMYVGGARDNAGALLIQQPSGSFLPSNGDLFDADKASEDAGSEFFDADGDGDLDLYVCSGGNEYGRSSYALTDRLYINNGKGNFKKSPQVLPTERFESTSTVKAADYDGDGDKDLFVGTRLAALQYGVPVSGYILNNDGKGKFSDATATAAPELLNVGMITDAAWSDIDGDKDQDLIIVGDYLPITIMKNDQGRLVKTDQQALAKSEGWWNRLAVGDIDSDGDMDFIVANHGLNSRFRADEAHPVCMYVNDFDQNGTIEHMLCTFQGDRLYPLALRHDLIAQIPSLKKKYLKYESYSNQTIGDIFEPAQLKEAIRLEAYELGSVVLINDGSGNFNKKHLPPEAQTSPIYGITLSDINGDGNLDILAGGNQYRSKPEVGRYDGSYGVYLEGDGKGDFRFVPNRETGLKVEGEVRDVVVMRIGSKPVAVFARNSDSIIAVGLPK
jgi:enediyne biosynthesis protein E4